MKEMKELTIDALTENIGEVLEFVATCLELNDCPLKMQTQIAIAVEEAFVNIAHYAYAPETGPATIRVAVSGEELQLEFEDAGKPYNPLLKSDPDINTSAEEKPIGGLGIFMIKKIMDSVQYCYEDSKNHLIMTKYLGYAHLSYVKSRRDAGEYSGLTIVDILRRHAREIPQRPALVYNEFSYSYSRLDRLSDLLALQLVRQGVVRGDRVGILSYHYDLAFLSVFGIVKAAAAYVPLNPQHPTQRLLHMIKDAGINVVVAGHGTEESIAGFSGLIINGREFINSIREEKETQEVPSELPNPTPEDLIMIEYTSGSTGNPKGVMLSHRNVLGFPAHYKRLVGLSANDALASYSNLSFIIHTHDFFAAILAGAAIHVIPNGIRLDPHSVNDYFEVNNVNAALVPFSFGRRFILQENNLTLRSFGLGGEQFIPLPELTHAYKIYNAYGCTECGGAFCFNEIKPGDSSITVGTPIDNMDIYLLDEKGSIVKRGEKGELCVAGPYVGAGYLNMAEKTAEVFIKNPFNNESGFQRLYKTGDLARVTLNGQVEIIGRVDFQIKIRGYRIEPGEIDACVRQFPGIIESVTVGIDDRAGAKHLVNYFAAEGNIDAEQLKQFIACYLPIYMVPQFVEQLPKLPRNVNGKLDRAALPPLRFEAEEYAVPENEIEEKLTRLWATVLGLDMKKISRNAEFFKLGGDSLRATILSFETSHVFTTGLSPVEIVKTPVLKDQAAVLLLAEGFKAVHVFSSGGAKIPLFFVHGGNIGPQALEELARNLSGDQSFYCFENYNLHHPKSRIKGISSVARHYIKAMREIVPLGPYAIGGWSYGGLVAFEMACLLQEAGDTVKHLYLMDPSLIREGSQEKMLNEKLLATNNYREYLAKDPFFERFRSLGLLDRLMENYQEVFRDMLDYTPSASYQGELTLFKALKPDPVNPGTSPEAVEIINQLWKINQGKSDNGFRDFAPKLRVIEIPDCHDGLGQGEAVKKIASCIAGS